MVWIGGNFKFLISFQEITESTVSAVKALLAATKDERSKRGKYFKYSQELKEEIAAYATVKEKFSLIQDRYFKLSNFYQ